MILILLEDGVPTPSWDTQETTSSRRCNIRFFFSRFFMNVSGKAKDRCCFQSNNLKASTWQIRFRENHRSCDVEFSAEMQPSTALSGWWFGLFFNLSILFQLSRDDFSPSWIGKAQVTSSIKPTDQVEAIPEAPEISFSGALCLGEGVPFGDPGRCGYDVLASGFMNLGFACPIWIIHRSVDVSSIDSNISGFWVWDYS